MGQASAFSCPALQTTASVAALVSVMDVAGWTM
jgi:hypothetical protein